MYSTCGTMDLHLHGFTRFSGPTIISSALFTVLINYVSTRVQVQQLTLQLNPPSTPLCHHTD